MTIQASPATATVTYREQLEDGSWSDWEPTEQNSVQLYIYKSEKLQMLAQDATLGKR